MPVRTAWVFSPIDEAAPMIERASARASSIDLMNAPEPTLTSMTRPAFPAATFFDRIEAVMSGIDSTVPVTSRMA